MSRLQADTRMVIIIFAVAVTLTIAALFELNDALGFMSRGCKP